MASLYFILFSFLTLGRSVHDTSSDYHWGKQPASHILGNHSLPIRPMICRSSPSPYWLEGISHRGIAAFNTRPNEYKVWRNVKDYGARGDGVTDDTKAINAAISDGNRCAPDECGSSTTTPAIVYFPTGNYSVSSPIIPYYMTQLIGNPNAHPVLHARSTFRGFAVIDAGGRGDGTLGWSGTNIFLRQIRNIDVDLTQISPFQEAVGIHWPTAQATSLQNIIITMSPGSVHKGIHIPLGSGGLISDIEVIGGLYGLSLGNQQFTMRDIKISHSDIGILQTWNWGWLYKDLNITNCRVAYQMLGGADNPAVGSAVFLDSSITGCRTFVAIQSPWTLLAANQIVLEKVTLSNVGIAVMAAEKVLYPGGTIYIPAWAYGLKWSAEGVYNTQGMFPLVLGPPILYKGLSFYSRSKPQYGNTGIESVMSIRAMGAIGDGKADDTEAVQKAIAMAASSGNLLFVDHGVYKVTKTIYVPPGTRMVGESYPVILAAGALWGNQGDPVPVVQIGRPGESGHFEWLDMVISTQGRAPGAKLIEWNLAADAGSGMWDVHTRIGGWKGTDQQLANCPKSAPVSEDCMAAFMSMHITKSGSGVYIENSWFWTADHDLDEPSANQISIYTGRGLLVEGSDIWLYGTGVEHHSLYQYQFSNAKNIFAGFMQTESPYWQSFPDIKNQPYSLVSAFNDPDFTPTCRFGSCQSLGLRIVDTRAVYIYGAGLYSFFNNYDSSCSATAWKDSMDCQSRIFSIEGKSSSIMVYGLNTLGSRSMLSIDGVDNALAEDYTSFFTETMGVFQYL